MINPWQDKPARRAETLDQRKTNRPPVPPPRLSGKLRGLADRPEDPREKSALPRYRGGDDPRSLIDRWAYFFLEAENLDVVPSALGQVC